MTSPHLIRHLLLVQLEHADPGALSPAALHTGLACEGLSVSAAQLRKHLHYLVAKGYVRELHSPLFRGCRRYQLHAPGRDLLEAGEPLVPSA